MGLPTWEQLTAMFLAIGSGWAWLVKRRDRVSDLDRIVKQQADEIAQLKNDLATAMTEAEKTNRSHEDAMNALRDEIAEWRRQVERRDDRITLLEDRLYTGGGTT